jgi:AraC-like DNA-binding protein/mannose-6-phosphate isomerase-like protein (cupin superfamily)
MENDYMLDLQISAMPIYLTAINTHDYETQSPYFRHRHDAFELHYIIKGNCTLRINEDIHVLREGEICLIAPGLYHSQKSFIKPFEKLCVKFEIAAPPEDSSDQEAADLYRVFHSMRVLQCSAEQMTDTLECLRSASCDFERQFGGHTKLRLLCGLLILELAQRIHCDRNQTVMPDFSPPDIRRNNIIEEFFNYHFHLNNGNTLLAQRLFVSERQLDRILKHLYRKSFREKLLEMRLEVATDLLATSNRSIAEISELTGYSCPANFSTFIKNATGKTPSEIRQRGKGGRQMALVSKCRPEIAENLTITEKRRYPRNGKNAIQ